LTSDPDIDRTAVWSPDGSKIAFMSNRGGTFQLYLMNADGTNQRRLIDGEEQTFFPSWSPDGRKMAFLKELSNGAAPCILDIDSGDHACPWPGSDEVCSAFTPWSPDGTRLAFCSHDKVHVLNVADGSLKVLSSEMWGPAWSPTGKQIACLKITGARTSKKRPVGLYVMESDGTNQRELGQLEPALIIAGGPAWSPDGSMLVFAAGEVNYEECIMKNQAIYVIGSDGSNLKEIVSGKYFLRHDMRESFGIVFIAIRARRSHSDITEPEDSPGWPPPDWPESREEYLERLRNTPTHLCRLRYFGDEERWGFAFYTYSNEKYELSVFPSGDFFGTPEEAFDTAAGVYLA
jgi:Tol biopolymer transport system component